MLKKRLYLLTAVLIALTLVPAACSHSSKGLVRKIREKNLDRRNEALLMFNDGVELLQTGQYEKAVASFERALQLDPALAPAAYNAAAVCDIALSDRTRAIYFYEKYLTLQPDDKEAQKFLSEIKASHPEKDETGE